MVDQWRHWGLWQRYWHRSPRTTVETGGSDSWGSNAEAWHDKSTLYFRASGGKEKHRISMLTQTRTNPDNVAISASSHELHLKPLSHFSFFFLWSHVTKNELRIPNPLLCQSARLVFASSPLINVAILSHFFVSSLQPFSFPLHKFASISCCVTLI